MLRRNFLKNAFAVATTAAATGACAKQFITIDEIIVPEEKPIDWIIDKGEYYLVNIPDGKTLKRERLDKPSIIKMGQGSTIGDLTVVGYCNIFSKHEIVMNNLATECGNYITKEPRSSILFSAPFLRVNGQLLIGNLLSQQSATNNTFKITRM